MSANLPAPISPRSVDTKQEEYVRKITADLRRWYFTEAGSAYLQTAEGRKDMLDHVCQRYEMFARHHVPWLQSKFDISNHRMIEVGCGTGSSALAFGSAVRSLDCYELSEGSRKVAMERVRYWGLNSVRFHSTLFDDSAVTSLSGPVDGILLTASLEHMTHVEAVGILRLCGRVLRPGGLLVICETPNRFALFDEHTSQIPLFSMLPRQIQVAYSNRSPRPSFRQTIGAALEKGLDQACEVMTRWGSGVSFHEFEIAFGDEVHSWVALDGYEPEMSSFFAVSDRDRHIEQLLRNAGVKVNRAFTRHYLNFVLQKPYT